MAYIYKLAKAKTLHKAGHSSSVPAPFASIKLQKLYQITIGIKIIGQ